MRSSPGDALRWLKKQTKRSKAKKAKKGVVVVEETAGVGQEDKEDLVILIFQAIFL